MTEHTKEAALAQHGGSGKEQRKVDKYCTEGGHLKRNKDGILRIRGALLKTEF